jgi:hypothetical protein
LNTAKWLLFLEAENVNDFLEDLYIPFDCDFLVAQGVTGMATADLEVLLLEVYHIEANSRLQANRVGIWKYDHSLTWSSIPYFKRRGNLRGITLRAAVYSQVRQVLVHCNSEHFRSTTSLLNISILFHRNLKIANI